MGYKNNKRVRRAFAKSFRMANPSKVNWQGMRPKPANADVEPPKTKGLSLDNLQFWANIKELREGELPPSCPPRMVTMLRYIEVIHENVRPDDKWTRQSIFSGVNEYHSVRMYQDEQRSYHMFSNGVRWFFYLVNFELKLQHLSITYSDRELALNAMWRDVARAPCGLTWDDTRKWEGD